MQNLEIRLECLKLAHRPDRSPQEVIAAAVEYLNWVGETNPQITDDSQPADIQKAGKKKLDPVLTDKSL